MGAPMTWRPKMPTMEPQEAGWRLPEEDIETLKSAFARRDKQEFGETVTRLHGAEAVAYYREKRIPTAWSQWVAGQIEKIVEPMILAEDKIEADRFFADALGPRPKHEPHRLQGVYSAVKMSSAVEDWEHNIRPHPGVFDGCLQTVSSIPP